MKFAPAIVSGITLLACASAGAAVTMQYSGATMAIETVTTVTGGVFASLPSTALFDTGTTQSGVTDMLVGPLTVSPTGENVYVGGYSMVDSSGSAVSTGIVKFTLPAAATYIGNRHVVGVIPLSGGLGNSSITLATASAALDGRTASVSYNTDVSVMQVTIGSASAYVPYVAADEATLVFESPFWLTDGPATYKFGKGYANRQSDGSYKGLISLADGSASYAVTLDDPNDSDADGVSDITDADHYWYSDCICYNGAEYSSWLGWFNFYYPPADGTTAWDDSYVQGHAYIWHYQHGLLYTFPREQDGVVWMYVFDMELGWTATNPDVYPYFYAFDVVLDGVDYGDNWLYYSRGGDSENRYFFAQTGKMNSGSNMGSAQDGFGGWWSIPGANSTK